MTAKGRLMRRSSAAVVGIAMAACLTPAADAASSSPHHTVVRFWNLASNGEGAKAFKLVDPSCRTAKIKKELIKASDAFGKYDVDVDIVHYREHDSGHRATVSYVVEGTLNGHTGKLSTVRHQTWLHKNGGWYAPCR